MNMTLIIILTYKAEREHHAVKYDEYDAEMDQL